MFRLISLNFENSILGHFPAGSLVFVPNSERGETKFPYTSVIIGQNGSGKSTILSYITEIFLDLAYYKENRVRNKNSKIAFSYTIEFESDNQNYKISQRRGPATKSSTGNAIPPGWFYQLTINNSDTIGEKTDWNKVQLPSNVIAVCYLPMDRFPKKANQPDDFYIYLGLVDNSNAARARLIMNNAVPMLFDTINKEKSVEFLKDILRFMQVDEDYLGIKNSYRYKESFFTGKLTESDFTSLFNNWRSFSKREEKPFGVNYFEANIAGNKKLISRIVSYLNLRAITDKIKIGEKSLLEFNLLDNPEILAEWELLIHLRKLDLIDSFSLLFRKSRANKIDDSKLSSGEFHYFSTIIAICGSIKENSLVLMDEPETSFHPNWQMKYINHLKFLLKNNNGAHFIIATHSHFIVSDLEGASSEIIGLNGLAPKVTAEPLERSTYGWSAEEVLYKVFNLRSTRNYFFEISLRELLHLISNKSDNKERIMALCKDLKNTELDRNDPLTQILIEADEYIRNL